jgi:predicted metal-dependent hydrolase
MADSQQFLGALFADAFRQLGGGRPVPEIEVRFYQYAGLRHTIRLRSGKVYVRLSDICRDAPQSALRAVAFMLVAKLLSRRVPEVHERVYRDYACSPQVLRASDIARQRRGRKVISSSRGRVYDLDKIFDRLNREHFDDRLEKPTLTWSQRRTRRILGHHDSVHDTIVISKTLDAREVPEWFVEYILYHEMLHIKHPGRIIDGRRYHHTNAFRADERRFPHYEKAQLWLERDALQRRGLLKSARAA